MHLIMNALEEVNSRAHPNVSKISLLITLVSASAEFKPAKKTPTESRNLGWPTTVRVTSLPRLLLWRDPGSSPAPSKKAANTSQLPAAFLLW